MGEFADRLHGRRITEASDTDRELRLTTDRGDTFVIRTSHILFVTPIKTKPGISDKPITDVPQ